ncbi:MAG: amino acid adenylation domain-containing protein [Cystobacter sp.]
MLDTQARAHADRVALADASTEVTYAQLGERTRALARRLRARGLGAGDVVAVVMERGIPFIETVLALWHIGAAYLPLAPAHPVAWREDVVRRAGAVLVVGDPTASAVPGVPHLDPEVLALDSTGVGLETPEDARALAPEALAYIICTSGSTGEPKLVMIEQRGVANLLLAQRDFLRGAGPRMRVLQFFHPSFDAALFDILMALGNGGRLELIDDACLSGARLEEVLRSRHITHAVLPVSVLRTLTPVGFPDLEVVMSIGDVCLAETARQWAAHRRFINGYGPTEITVGCTLHTVDSRQAERVPIGRPLPQTHLVLLDEHLRPVPPGSPGEICIGGSGVGRGYLGQPALTAERFIPDPFSPTHGGRLYRTGDLGRLLADGSLDFLGRRDDQVKVRGARIELGQVERALRALSGVRDAVAVVDGAGERLFGYVLPGGQPTPDVDALRAALRLRLPAYLVPDVLVALDEWPLTLSGKVDRSRLPRPPGSRTEREGSPRTPQERALADLAARLLGLERVGVHDDLFALGGHSLFATQLVARVRAEWGAHLELSAVLTTPVIAELAARLPELPRAVDPGPRRAEPGTPLVPSSAQQRVWLMHKLHPEARAYHTQAVLRLEGELVRAALNASLTDLLRRQDVLRMRFPEVDGELRCELDAPWEVDVPVRDLQDVEEARRADVVGEAVREWLEAPFDLAGGRPFRWLLLQLGAREHVFVHVEHHIVHDGWSFNLFVRELLDGYADHVRHGRGLRAAPPVSYADYARWQREWCGSREAEAQRRFWRQELEGAETVLALPRAPVPSARRFRGVAPRMELDGVLANRLRALAERGSTSLFTTLLAAFFVLLHRYTGSQDVLVGSGVANRRWRDTEGLLGMFVNTVVLRGRLHGDPSFSEFLERVRRTTLAVYDHQELPYGMIFAESPARQDEGAHPLIQTLFSFHDAPHGALGASPLDVTVVEGLSNGSAKFELSVVAVPRYAREGHIRRLAGDVVHIPRSDVPVPPSPASALSGITLAWEFDTDLFDATFISGILEAYQTLLHAIVEGPDTRVSALSLLDEARQRALMVSGPRPPLAMPWIPWHVERQAERTPDAPALRSREGVRSYSELVREARQWAYQLRARGIGRGDRVALCLPVSERLAVAQLGVWFTGAAFVPLDPRHPPAHLARILHDAAPALVLTSRALVERVSDLPVLLMDAPAAAPETPLPPGAPNDLAYLLYTSGSTGGPKGVLIEHHSVVARLRGLSVLGLGPGKTMLALASPGFDVSVLEVWGALMNGAAVHFLEPGWTPREVARCVGRGEVTHLCPTPAVFHTLVAGFPESFDRIEQVAVAGDVVSPEAFRALRRRGVSRVTNVYGPTEATIFASSQELTDWHGVEGASVPIGRPPAHGQLAVLDAHSRAVPPGVVGEICIAGPGLARGYLGQPGLTAERFVPHPFATEPGERLYRTGDLGRWLPGGVLEFVGRRDEQVKIRGVRVELAEVRAALLSHPGVTDAVAVVERPGGEARLIGYVRAAPEARLSGPSVREAMERRVPGAFVPDVIMVLDAWPLNASGKLERARLPAPYVQGDAPFTAPRTEREARIATLVAGLLVAARVGVHDSLFSLGLHSLQAIRLASRLSTMTGHEVSPATIFAHPTVARLAQVLPSLPSARPSITRLPRA